jgi:hypothetical protein
MSALGEAHVRLRLLQRWFASESTPQIGGLITQRLRGSRHDQ